jgi:hypothetical protein
MLRFRLLLSIFCLAFVASIPAPAWSLDSLVVSLDEAAAIVNPEDQTDVRILLKFDPLTSLDSNDVVMIAKLRSTVNVVNAPARSILLHVDPLGTDWNANTVGWSSPWTNAGGDIEENLSVMGRITQADSQNVQIDITRIIKRIAAGSIDDYGIMLRQIGATKRQFAVRNSSQPGGGHPLVELVIYYMTRE